MRLFIYILTIIYFAFVSLPVFIIIFIASQTFYTLKTLTTWLLKNAQNANK